MSDLNLNTDSKTGMLVLRTPEKPDYVHADFRIEAPANEPFENKISESTSGHVTVRRVRDMNLRITRSNRNVEIFGNVITISYVPRTFNLRRVFDRFNTEEIEQRLSEIRQETQELYVADEIDKVYETAYTDIKSLLSIINARNPRVPMPDIDWADDGSLNATWIQGNDIITMGVYGNNILHFNFYFGHARQNSGVCELSDKSVLNGYIQILDNILQE